MATLVRLPNEQVAFEFGVSAYTAEGHRYWTTVDLDDFAEHIPGLENLKRAILQQIHSLTAEQLETLRPEQRHELPIDVPTKIDILKFDHGV